VGITVSHGSLRRGWWGCGLLTDILNLNAFLINRNLAMIGGNRLLIGAPVGRFFSFWTFFILLASAGVLCS